MTTGTPVKDLRVGLKDLRSPSLPRNIPKANGLYYLNKYEP